MTILLFFTPIRFYFLVDLIHRKLRQIIVSGVLIHLFQFFSKFYMILRSFYRTNEIQ